MNVMRRFFDLMLTALMVIPLSCGESEQQTNVEQRRIPVKTRVLVPLNEDVVKTYTGSVEGEKQAIIYCKIAEAVDSVHVREGDAVRADQVLVSLDRSGPSSSYLQSESVYLNAEKHNKKMAYLFEQGAVSESDHDAARTDYEVARASFEAARQLVDIQSPIAGTVTSLNVSHGDYLYAGQAVATVATVDRLRVKFGVNAADLHRVNEGDSVMVSAETVTQSAAGVVTSVARSADPITRAFQVEVAIDNIQGAYRPGMFVRIDIVLDRLTGVVAVPRDAVQDLSDESVAYIVQNGEAHRRTVDLDVDMGGRVVVSSGLSAGDTLVVLGQDYLEDGTLVSITDVEAGE